MNNLIKSLEPLYGNRSFRVKKELELYASSFKPINNNSKPPFWHSYISIYGIYPNGVIFNNEFTPLQNLTHHLPRIKQLGCNAIHIMPFLKSPMKDDGFDISDFYKIRKGIGNLNQLKYLIRSAKKANINLFMDLVFNHVSDQHDWFRKAVSGDHKYRKFFITTKIKPQFLKKYSAGNAVWADYLINGERKAINIAFPDQTGEIPHWVQSKDGIWYYHTYYPQQIDLNWSNPEVFIEMGKVLIYWASLGFNFRLDAIPFIGKSAYKLLDTNNAHPHLITAGLKSVATAINPECAFLIETYEKINTIGRYFGSPDAPEADLAYNFHLCTNLWVSLITRDCNYIWDKLKLLNITPVDAQWLNFLRNHDELSLAYLSETLAKEVKKELLKYGRPFREGCGISGRTFSLLGRNKKRFFMAYLLLASLPGGLDIPYGDEIGVANLPLNRLSAHQRKDTRNINRGTFSKANYETKRAIYFRNTIRKIITKRLLLSKYPHVWPEKMTSAKEIFLARYKKGSSELIVAINLSDKPQEITLADCIKYKIVMKVNLAKTSSDKIYLGAYGGIWIQNED